MKGRGIPWCSCDLLTGVGHPGGEGSGRFPWQYRSGTASADKVLQN